MSSSEKLPVMVSPNFGKSAETSSALLARLDLYGSRVSERSNGRIDKIVLLAGVKASDLSSEVFTNYSYLKIIRVSNPTSNILRFAVRSRFLLKINSISPRLLVSSDLYFGFLSTFFTFILLGASVPIQVSVHGNILRDDDRAIKQIVRKVYISFVFRIASSIRIVSKELKSQIFSQFKLHSNKVFIAPIPVDFPMIKTGPKSKVIAFVGRLHEERGVEEWANVICSLHQIRQDFSVFIIGDGPLRGYLNSRLDNDSPQLSFKNFGYLTRSEVNEIWPEVKVLLSSAKSEGYGLSLREAIISSAFVLARSNSGSDVLRDEIPHLVFTYKNVSEAVSKLDWLLNSQFPDGESEKFRVKLEERNRNTLNKIATSWIS